ncbi:MAG: acryloyl-CoA reductase [Thermoleophilia bacterium]
MSDTFRAFVADHEAGVPSGVREMSEADLEGDVLIDVSWSSLNYKDGLASIPEGKVARRSPLIVGIDVAGTVVSSSDDRYRPGDGVIAHGYDIGVGHHGGLAQRAKMPGDWVVRLPEGMDARAAMVLGTAGYTALASILALEEERGLEPADGPVLVTGATGGVGSTAVAILAKRGYEVIASTGKESATDWLKALGATEVVGREAVSDHAARPLSKQLWAACVDSVGGQILAGALSALKAGGAIAASGLTGGAKLETTVMPFILRGCALLGIDSSVTPQAERQRIWDLAADDYRPADLEALVHGEIGLDAVTGNLQTILKGGMQGRVLVEPGR